jgi:DNA-binding LacI/PurR family transcriptional regulator
MRGGKKAPTLKDVARVAKVSASTVSRVATRSALVDANIEQRVRKAAHDIGFDLTRKRPRVIALLLGNREILHPYHSHVLSGAESYCAAHDYNILFLTFRYDLAASAEDLNLPRALHRHDLVCGFILAGTNSPHLLELLAGKRLPFAVLGDNVVGEWDSQNCDVVWSDDVRGAFEMTRYVQSLGHRDIWFVGSRRLPWFNRRFQGYAEAMTSAGMEVRSSEFHLSAVDEVGYLATKEILGSGKPVSAIFAAGDLAAEGVYRALRDRGLRVPDDISVVGFNDIEAAVMHPPLTTVRQFPEQVGHRLARMILNRLASPDLAPQDVVIPTQLIKRESCRSR